jgi:hypothetical protein
MSAASLTKRWRNQARFGLCPGVIIVLITLINRSLRRISFKKSQKCFRAALFRQGDLDEVLR